MKYRSRMGFGLCAVVLLLWSAGISWAQEVQAPAKTNLGRPENLVPYVSTPMEVVEEMLKMADVKSTDTLFDLGCGDGRIVVTAAKKYGCRAVGVDIDPDRVKEARELAKKEGVENKVTILQEDLAKTRFSTATVVTMYLLPSYNAALRPKLERVLPLGARVVSHDFDMPPGTWTAVIAKDFKDSDGHTHQLYLWKITPEMKQRAAGAKEGANRPGGKRPRAQRAKTG